MRKVSKRKMLIAALTAGLIMQQSVLSGALATNITGVEGNNGVYNINPTDLKGDTGFRKYQNFTLSEGDIANLIFKFGKENVEKFVNLVDNTININGLVNSMRDGNFYNGHAIFVSPNGMVVGASGVLNVGALSVYTPSQLQYDKYLKNNYTGDISSLKTGNADVTINGKVLSRGDINILAKDATVASTGALLAGINNTEVLTSQQQADALFNSLVNATGIKVANTMELQDGNIVIKTDNRDGGINIAGLLKNEGKGDIVLANNGTKDLRVIGAIENKQGNVSITDRQSNTIITGNITNEDGKLAIINNAGEFKIASSANLKNKGEMRLVNRGENGQIIDGNVSNDGLTLVSSNAGKTVINGKIVNQNGRLTIVSNGSGLEVGENGEISNNNEIKIGNTGKEGFKMSGTVKNSASTALTNWAGDYIIDGTIENANGKMNLSNASSKMHLTEKSKVSNNGDLQIINSGRNGLTLDGEVKNTSTTNVWNVRGDLDVSGAVDNSNGKLTITNDGNALNIWQDATITNDSTTVITNTGNGGLNHSGVIGNTGMTVLDNQAGDLYVDGIILQQGNRVVLKNSGNALNLIGGYDEQGNAVGATIYADNADVTVFNTGDGGTNIIGADITSISGDTPNKISVVNQKGDLNIQGTDLINTNGDISLSNSGEGMMFITETTNIANGNGKVGILNTGKSGAKVDATIVNNGITNISNKAGHLTTEAKIANQNGKLEIVNNGESLTVGANAHITNNAEIKIANTGNGGMQIKGNIENNGSTGISNWAGDMVISGKVENQNGKMNITSAKNSNSLHLTKEGQLLNNNDELYVQNTGKGGMKLDGEVKNNSTTTLYNLAGDMEVNGLVQNKGELMISNRGQNLTIGQNSIIENNANTTIRNAGLKGMNINGRVTNENGVVNIENKAGTLDMSKGARITNDGAEINVTNSSYAAMNLDGRIYSLDGKDINLSNTSEKGGIILGENGLVKTDANVNVKNIGTKGVRVRGNVNANDINVDNENSLVFLGNPNAKVDENAKANLNASNNVNINLENGSLLNAGTQNKLISADGNLTIKADNGKIGFETGTSGGGYTYGPTGAQVDTTKSINIDVKGLINAQTNDTKGTTGDYVINLASKGADMNVDYIKADGRVLLLTDGTLDKTTGSILNASTDATRPNIEAKGLSLISSGKIGTEDKALNINDTNYAYKSDYQALKDINLYSFDDQYNKADVRYIISNDGKINAEFTGLARVKDTYSGSGEINVTNRTGKMNLINNGTTPNTGHTYYNFRGEGDIMLIGE